MLTDKEGATGGMITPVAHTARSRCGCDSTAVLICTDQQHQHSIQSRRAHDEETATISYSPSVPNHIVTHSPCQVRMDMQLALERRSEAPTKKSQWICTGTVHTAPAVHPVHAVHTVHARQPVRIGHKVSAVHPVHAVQVFQWYRCIASTTIVLLTKVVQAAPRCRTIVSASDRHRPAEL